MIGIYSITNKVNGKMYVGQSSDIENRWKKHIRFLNDKSHHNKHLQAAWNKFGEENFEFKVIEECKENELNERETYYISKYDTYNSGYNLDLGGEGIRGYKHTPEQILKMRKAHNPLVVLQFDLSKNLIKRWDGGIGRVNKELHYTTECIRRLCCHEGKNMHPYKDCYWMYEQEYQRDDFSWEAYFSNRKIEIDKSQCQVHINKKIIQYDKDKNIVKTWNSLAEIRKAVFNSHQISSICHEVRGKKTHAGCIWAYEDYDFSDGYFDSVIFKRTLRKEKPIKRNVKRVPVNQYTLDKQFVRQFESLLDAAKSIGYTSSGNIARSCKSKFKRMCAGYYWERA